MPATVLSAATLGAFLGKVGAVKFAIAGSTILGGAVLYGGIGALQYGLNRVLQKKPTQAVARGRQTVQIERFPAQWVIGRARTGGWLCWVRRGRSVDDRLILDRYEQNDRHFHCCIALSVGPVQGIEGMWINGSPEPFIFADSNQLSQLIPNSGGGGNGGNGGNGGEGGQRHGQNAGENTISKYLRRAPLTNQSFIARTDGSYVLTPRRTGDVELPVGSRELSEHGITRQDVSNYAREISSDNTPELDRYTVWPYLSGDGVTGRLSLDLGDNTAFQERGSGLTLGDLDTWNTRDHQAKDVTYVIIDFYQPKTGNNIDNAIWNSIPQIEFLVNGYKILVPKRDGTETRIFGNRAADVIYWFLRERVGLPMDAIDVPSFIAARDIGKQFVIINGLPVGYPNHFQRYTINGVISAEDDNEVILAEMLLACGGDLIEYDGKIRLVVGVEVPPSYTIQESSILNMVNVQPAPSLNDRLNALRMGLNQSALHQYTNYSLKRVEDEQAITRDGRVLEKDIGTRAFINNPTQAHMLAIIELRRARASHTFTYRLASGPNGSMDHMSLLPGQRVSFNDSEMGLVNAKMEILDCRIEPDMSVLMVLRHAPDGIYEDSIELGPLLPGKIFFPELGPHTFPENTFNWRGEWTLGEKYEVGDVVSYEGSTYRCILAHTATEANRPTKNGNDWWTPIALAGVDGNSTEWIYKRVVGETKPAKPTSTAEQRKNDDYIPTGWTDDPLGTSATYHTEWVSTRNKEAGDESWSEFSEPALWSHYATDGDRNEAIYRGTSSRTAPATPSTSATQDTTNDYVPTGWSNNSPGITNSNPYVWISNRHWIPTSNKWSKFSTPVLWAEKGNTGEDGEDGQGYEHVYCRVGLTQTIPSTAYPLNTWRFDQMGNGSILVGGCHWYDNPPTAIQNTRVMQCSRRIKGTPSPNEVRKSGNKDYVLTNWTNPVVYSTGSTSVTTSGGISTQYCLTSGNLDICGGYVSGTLGQTRWLITFNNAFREQPIVQATAWLGRESWGPWIESVTTTGFIVNATRPFMWMAIGRKA